VGFHSLKRMGRSSCFICLLDDFVPCKSIFKMVVDKIIKLCAGSGLVPRLEAKYRASDSPIQASYMIFGQASRFACRRLLCSASRTSRDTAQSSIAWTLHASLLISRGLKCSNVEGLRFQSHGSSWLTGGSKNRKKALLALETAAIMRMATRFPGCQLYKLER
jgi:hypothetical protein